MSYSQPNYMEGVPVKISEKYKPPPKISLPQKRNVLVKIAEWKSVRNRDQTERRDRIRQRQLERQQMVDERQKQLLTAVSYPSAEDLSDDEPERSNEPEQLHEPVTELRFSSPNFDTIFMPTVMPGHETTYSNQSTNFSHINNSFRSGYASSFNYSDFENDTSSPFDSVELKTINDLDILAQVLNTLQTNDTHTPETTSTESTASSDNTPVQQQTILPNDNTIDPNSHFYQQPTNETTIGYGSMTANQTEGLTEFPRYAATYQTNENYYNFDNRNKQAQHLSNAVDVLPTTFIPNNEFYYDYNSPTMGIPII